jgi:hypothetical protein
LEILAAVAHQRLDHGLLGFGTDFDGTGDKELDV